MKHPVESDSSRSCFSGSEHQSGHDHANTVGEPRIDITHLTDDMSYIEIAPGQAERPCFSLFE